MTTRTPQRWPDAARGPAEANAAKLVDAVKRAPVEPLSDAALAQAQLSLAAAARAAKPGMGAKLTVGAALLVLIAAASGAAWIFTRVQPATALVVAPQLKQVVVAPAPIVQEEQKAPEALEAPLETTAPLPKRRKVLPEDDLLEESRLLKLAVTELREEHAPGRALTTLDGYFRRFPKGTLSADARVVRVETLLALDRRDTALAELNRFAASNFAGLPRAEELRVMRAELLASMGRYPEALTAFDAALGSTSARDLRERAIFGRAGSLSRLGRDAESQTELKRYLSLFPDGRFAQQARAALKTP